MEFWSFILTCSVGLNLVTIVLQRIEIQKLKATLSITEKENLMLKTWKINYKEVDND